MFESPMSCRASVARQKFAKKAANCRNKMQPWRSVTIQEFQEIKRALE